MHNNPYALQILKDIPKAKVVWIANGTMRFQALSQIPRIDPRHITSQIDIVPNTRNRMNVPALVV